MQSDLVDEISTALLSEHANLDQLYGNIVSDIGLSPSEADHFLYHIIRQLNLAFFPPLTDMELILTEGCNLACSYCFEKEMVGYEKMSQSVARASVDLLFDYSLDEKELHITHFGGEPLLNFPMVQYVTEYAEEKAGLLGKSLELSMTSNGILLDESIANYLADHKISVLLSIDGCESTHNRFRIDRQGRGTFDKVIKGLRVLKRVQPWIGVKMTVMPENVPRLYEDVLGLYDLGVNQFIIGHATGVEWSGEGMNAYGEELRRVAQWYRGESRQDLKIAEFDHLDKASGYFGCRAGRNSISVSANGEISACSKVLSLNNRQLLAKLGDVRHGLTCFRNRAELISCSKLYSACEAQGIEKDFLGGCFASNYSDAHDIFQPSIQEYKFSLLERSIRSEFAPPEPHQL